MGLVHKKIIIACDLRRSVEVTQIEFSVTSFVTNLYLVSCLGSYVTSQIACLSHNIFYYPFFSLLHTSVA